VCAPLSPEGEKVQRETRRGESEAEGGVRQRPGETRACVRCLETPRRCLLAGGARRSYAQR